MNVTLSAASSLRSGTGTRLHFATYSFNQKNNWLHWLCMQFHRYNFIISWEYTLYLILSTLVFATRRNVRECGWSSWKDSWFLHTKLNRTVAGLINWRLNKRRQYSLSMQIPTHPLQRLSILKPCPRGGAFVYSEYRVLHAPYTSTTVICQNICPPGSVFFTPSMANPHSCPGGGR